LEEDVYNHSNIHHKGVSMPKDISMQKLNQLLIELEAKLNLIKFQSGDITIQAPDLRGGQGDRIQTTYVDFPEPFSKLPEISIGFSLIDAGGADDGMIRVNLTPDNISERGFGITLSTWHSTKVHQAKVNWLAYTTY